MNEYEMIDDETGEITTFSSEVDLSLLESYNQWVIDNKLTLRTFSPQEYAEHMENEYAKIRVKRALAFIDKYDLNVAWPPELYRSLREILKNAKE